MWKMLALAAVFVMLSGDKLVLADIDECNASIDALNAAMHDAINAVDAYGNCVGNSRGQDDCNSYFSSLYSAHNSYSSAASQYKWKCTEFQL